ncbi:hypothetical protein V2J09_007039 [Rumex salicifolius]
MADYVETDPSGRYGRFGEMLGKGAMKIVYRAFDEVLGMEVAWNQVMLNEAFLSPDDIQRLYTEVHLLKNLKHKCIIQFYTSWIDNDRRTFNFITEMFSSGTLRNYRQKYKRVDIRAIKNWARQILHGLVYLHNHDPLVIHRDLKCDNIFVNGHLGQVKIGDLGLAAILHSSLHAHSLIGTPEFMAPELYEEEYNELVDVYSFGMCVLEMLSCEYPYRECSNTAQIYKKVISGKKPNAFYRIQDIKAQQFVGKCLEVATKRLPAHQLLLDPFLATIEAPLPTSSPPLQIYSPKELLMEDPLLLDDPIRNPNMTITGKVNPKDSNIFLQVQIVDSDGHARNVHFSFDVVQDTTIDVAMEMVNELDITDWESFEIAAMIEEEISSLVPKWKESQRPSSHTIPHHIFTYEEEEQQQNNKNDSPSSNNDDISSQTSHNSFNYSNISYEEMGQSSSTPRGVGSTRFCAEEKAERKPQKGKASLETKMRKLRSFMDIRSQLLHKALKNAVHGKRSFKTVGSVEGIGFRDPEMSGNDDASSRGAVS